MTSTSTDQSPRDVASTERKVKRIRTSKPCDYCKAKKIRCDFPSTRSSTSPTQSDKISRAPCGHCIEYGLDCIVKGVNLSKCDTASAPQNVGQLPIYGSRKIKICSPTQALHLRWDQGRMGGSRSRVQVGQWRCTARLTRPWKP